MTEPRLLTASDADASARSLADAFADDPVMGWAGGFDDDPRRLVPLFEATIAMCFRHPEPLMYTTDGHVANAVWSAPGHSDMSNSALLRMLPAMARSFRLGLPRLARMATAMEKVHPKEPHYYLFAVGVRRTHQGHGAGSAVMQPVLDRCDAEGLPAYLENSKPENEAFYVRHGFEPREPVPLPDGAPPFTAMWRTPG